MPTPRLRKTRSRAFSSNAVQYTSPLKRQPVGGRRAPHNIPPNPSLVNAEAGPSRLSPGRPPQKRLRAAGDRREPAVRRRRLTESESEEIFADDSGDEDENEDQDEDKEYDESENADGGVDEADPESDEDDRVPARAIGVRKKRSLNRILSPLTKERSINRTNANELTVIKPNRGGLPVEPGKRDRDRGRDRGRRHSSSVPQAHVHFRTNVQLAASRQNNNTRRGQLRSHPARTTPRKQVQSHNKLSRISSLLAAGSPRKRKRDDVYSDTDASGDTDGDEERSNEGRFRDAQDSDGDVYMDRDEAEEREDGNRTFLASRQVEDEEAEGSSAAAESDVNDTGLDIIADSDQHLLHEATVGQLNRLRKAELIRLWKVAGMWTGVDELDDFGMEREGGDSASGREHLEEEMGKKELVEGIIEARATRQPVSAARLSQKALALSRQSSVSLENPSPRRSSASSDVDESSVIPGKGKPFVRDRDAPRKMKTRHSLSAAMFEGDRRAKSGTDGNSLGAVHQIGRDRRSSHGSSASSSKSDSGSPHGLRPRPSAIARGKKPLHGVDRAARQSFGREDRPIEVRDSGDDGEFGDDNATADDEAVDTETDSVEEGPASHHRTAAARDRRKLGKRPSRNAKEIALAALAEGESDVEAMDIEDNGEGGEAGSDEDTEENEASVEAIDTPERYRKRGPTTRSRSGVFTNSPSGGSPARGRRRTARDDAGSLSPEPQYVSSDEESSGLPDSPSVQHRPKGSRRSSLVLRLEEMDIDGEDAHEVGAGELDSSESDGSQSLPDEDMDAGEGADAEDTSHELAEEDPATLLRYKKQTLVRMCEARELATDGTKRDLVSYLLGWRDAEQARKSAPSSASTARPTSTHSSEAPPTAARPIAVPVLLRNHSTVEDPDTPPLSLEHEGQEAVEGGLDLEELGLLDREIDASKIEKGAKIGSGGYKDVFIGKIGSKSVAICEFRGSLSEMDIRELKLLAEFDHPNIVRLLGLSVPEDKSIPCMIVTELCHKGDLFDYIRKIPAPPLRKILKIMIDIASGLEYLHERTPKVIHRDCKSSNILITSSGKAKVGDFGLARVKSTSRSVINSLVGTVNWQAPELWHPRPRYDYKVDVFSCGMVFWEMLHGWHSTNIQYPWEGKNEHWIYDAVGQKRQRPATSILRKHWGGDIVEVVERMWAHDPAERPTMTDVLDDLRVILAEQPKPPMRL